MDEKVRIDDGGEKKDGRKGTSKKRGKSGLLRQLIYQNVLKVSLHDDCQLFVGKLIHIHIGNAV